MTTGFKAVDADERLPALSVEFAVMLYELSASVVEVMVQAPALSAVVVPFNTALANKRTVLFASAVPLKVGVLMLVTLSLLMLLSDEASKSGVDGGLLTVSIVTLSGSESGLRVIPTV